MATLGGIAAVQLAAILWSVLSLPSAPSAPTPPGDAAMAVAAVPFIHAQPPGLPTVGEAGGPFGTPDNPGHEVDDFDIEAATPLPSADGGPDGDAASHRFEGLGDSGFAGEGESVAVAQLPAAEAGAGGFAPPVDPYPAPAAARPASIGGSGEIPIDEALDFAATSIPPIADPILAGFASAGAQHRAAGNTQRALAALREAEQALPEHPRILAELAATYELMGLVERAGPLWERITALGRISAGAYRGIAEARLRGEPVTAASLGLETGTEEPRPILRIGEVAVEEGEAGIEGQSVALRVVIDGDREQAPEVEHLALVVFFYDLVDETRIEASTADTLEEYPSVPYDWLDTGTEEIVVTYRQPVFTPEELRNLGSRRYYGYVIELYYQDELLDKVIMPEELAVIAPPSGSGSSPGGLGPENALFPPGI